MRVLSFGWTYPAVIAGANTRTRRDWSPSYAKRLRAGDLLAAWTHLPRVVSKDPRQFGFRWLAERGYRVGDVTREELFSAWWITRPWKWVVDSEVVSLEANRV